jgi:hypothetical protein
MESNMVPSSTSRKKYDLHVSIWLIMLIIAKSVSDLFQAILDHLLDHQRGWNRIGAFFVLTVVLLLIFWAMTWRMNSLNGSDKLPPMGEPNTIVSNGPMGHTADYNMTHVRSHNKTVLNL